jgi:hypothetical protein
MLATSSEAPTDRILSNENLPMRYTFHRYPVELIHAIELACQRVIVRTVLLQDEPLTQDFVRGLSSTFRYNRLNSGWSCPNAGSTTRSTSITGTEWRW